MERRSEMSLWCSRTERFIRVAVPLGILAACSSLGGEGAQGPDSVSATTQAQVSQTAPVFAIEPGPNALIDVRLQPAPDEFEKTDEAVWDGNRTLQGIWVAHPDAQTARRVRILNLETGYAVDGALFRRDGSVDGPTVMVSSDAAVTLGMTPNEAVTLSIVAIRRVPLTTEAMEQIAVADTLAPETEVEGTPETEPEASASEETALTEAVDDVAEVDAAQEADVDNDLADDTALPIAEDLVQVDADTETEVALAQSSLPAVGDEQVEAVPEPESADILDEEPTITDGSQERRSIDSWPILRDEAAAAEQQASVDEDLVPASSGDAAVVEEPDTAAVVAVASVPEPDPGSETAPAAEPSSPDTVESEPETDVERAGAEPAPQAEEVVETASVEPEAETPPATTPETVRRPNLAFIQSGIFGVEENAQRLIKRLADAGFPTQGKPFRSGERQLTRVVSGPFETQEEVQRALTEIRRIGPRDALPVRR